MKQFYNTFSFVMGLLFIGSTTQAQIRLFNYDVDTIFVATNLDTPWEITWGKDNHIWFTERVGNIYRLNPETKKKKLIAKLTNVYEVSESGMLGMALHPSFPDSNFVYVVYNYRQNNTTFERLSKFTYLTARDTLINERTLLESIKGANNHNGSRLVFGPDGHLYMSSGDAQDVSTSQNTTSLNGKILRITSSGKIPAGNPFNSYVWSIGHRNPQGLAFAPNGNLLSSEHGANQDDEINLIKSGANFGWPDIEGKCNETNEVTFCNANKVVEPLFTWTPTIATAGMEVYAGTMFPELNGKLLLTSMKNNLRVLTMNSSYSAISADKEELAGMYGRLRDICIGNDGSIYISTSNKDGRGTARNLDDKIIRLTNKAVTGNSDKSNNVSLYIYPNPNFGQLHINGYDQSMVALEIYSTTGALIYKQALDSETKDISNLSSGYYLYKIKDAAGATIKQDKFIIEKK